jgi:response regulator RpfG family c-di-GMP phosphodiesterase
MNLSEGYRSIFAETVKTLSDNAVPATVVLAGVADSMDQLVAETRIHPRMSKAEIKEIVNRLSPRNDYRCGCC